MLCGLFNRRDVIGGLAGAAGLWHVAARAQQTAKPHVI